MDSPGFFFLVAMLCSGVAGFLHSIFFYPMVEARRVELHDAIWTAEPRFNGAVQLSLSAPCTCPDPSSEEFAGVVAPMPEPMCSRCLINAPAKGDNVDGALYLPEAVKGFCRDCIYAMLDEPIDDELAAAVTDVFRHVRALAIENGTDMEYYVSML